MGILLFVKHIKCVSVSLALSKGLRAAPVNGILRELRSIGKTFVRTEIIKTDVVIIGAGPVGLFAVFQCGTAGLKCHVVDALDEMGGQCIALYPEKPIYDIPGFSKITALDLISNLTAQAAPFDPVYHLGQPVSALESGINGRWNLETSSGLHFDAGAVIIAAGVGAFEHKRPPLADLEVYEQMGPGRGINYLVKNIDQYEGKRIVIAGGGDSAVDWALALMDVAKSIALVHRRAKFRAHEASLEQLNDAVDAGKIERVVPFQLMELIGSGDGLEAIDVADLDGNTRRLDADVLLSFFGLAQKLGPINDWDLEIDKKRILTRPTTGETNVPGIFAIGDIANYSHKQKLILTGFSEAAFAAEAAHNYIFPETPLRFQHSTSRGLPETAVNK